MGRQNQDQSLEITYQEMYYFGSSVFWVASRRNPCASTQWIPRLVNQNNKLNFWQKKGVFQ
jgi:hypothetical protein